MSNALLVHLVVRIICVATALILDKREAFVSKIWVSPGSCEEEQVENSAEMGRTDAKTNSGELGCRSAQGGRN